MSWTAPRTWVTGEVVTSSEMNTHVRDNELDLDARQKQLFDSGFLGAPQANFDISSISAAYNKLIVEAYLRSDRAANPADDWKLTFNGDTGNNYNGNAIVNAGGTVSGLSNNTQTANIQAGTSSVPAATATANYWGSLRIECLAYAGTTNFKVVTFESYAATATGTANRWSVAGGGEWLSAVAINRLTLAPALGSNWIAGSRLLLYGVT